MSALTAWCIAQTAVVVSTAATIIALAVLDWGVWSFLGLLVLLGSPGSVTETTRRGTDTP